MLLHRGKTQSSQLLSSTLLLISSIVPIGADECPPATWGSSTLRDIVATPRIVFNNSASVARIGGDIKPGEINCRYPGSTYNDVNHDTCTKLAERYGIKLDVFFILNPELDPDCGNIQKYTNYCVAGCKVCRIHKLSQEN